MAYGKERADEVRRISQLKGSELVSEINDLYASKQSLLEYVKKLEKRNIQKLLVAALIGFILCIVVGILPQYYF